MRKTILLFTIFLTITYGQNGAKYLIITHDNFYDAILPLAQWKHKKGVPTKVVKLSDLNATPESIIRIKNYIINAYNTWSPRPEYILLVGGPQFIRSNQNKYDDYFSDVSGNYLMELSVGRFPCSTATQCSVIVNKTLGYERATFLSDTLWYKKGTGIVREDGAEHPDTVYWNNIRYVFSLWQSAGYTHIDSFSKFRGDSARHVESAITDGRAIVVFRGQGVANWWSPFEINVNRINNGYKLPIIVSGTCATINLAPNTPSYLGENFLKAGSVTTPNGAVGFVGSTNTESSTGLAVLRGVVAINFIKAIFAEQIYKIGDALKRAKFILDSLQLPNYTIIRYREWNLLGDPELSCWTDVPKQLTVTYDSVIGTGQQTFTVTVQQNTNPVPNALVCIMQDTLIYQSDYTNNFGQVSFSINPQTIGSMSLTVTAHNYCPYEGIVRIYLSGLEENSTKLENKLGNIKIYPNPCQNIVEINYSPSLTPNPKIKFFDIQGRIINAPIKLFTDRRILINTAKLPTGIYFVVLKNNNQALIGRLVKH